MKFHHPHHYQLLILFTKSAAPPETLPLPVGALVGAGSGVKNFKCLELEPEPEILIPAPQPC